MKQKASESEQLIQNMSAQLAHAIHNNPSASNPVAMLSAVTNEFRSKQLSPATDPQTICSSTAQVTIAPESTAFPSLDVTSTYSGNGNECVFVWLDDLEEKCLLSRGHDDLIVKAALASSRGLAKSHLLNLAVRMKKECGMLNWKLLKEQFLDHTKWNPMAKHVSQSSKEDPHDFFIRCESMFRHLAYLSMEDRLAILNGKSNKTTQKYLKFALQSNLRIETTDDWFSAVMHGKKAYDRAHAQCCYPLMKRVLLIKC
jgi:hypothetical protein